MSDEAWFTLNGHVMNRYSLVIWNVPVVEGTYLFANPLFLPRKNTVIYAPWGAGTPVQWRTEAEQGPGKVSKRETFVEKIIPTRR